MKKHIFLYCNVIQIVMIGFFYSCNSSPNKFNSIPKSEDSVIKEIPDRKRSDSFLKHKLDFEKQLGLINLENGFDGMQIRISRDYPFSDTSILIIFTSNQEDWTGKLYRIKYNFNKQGSLTSINKKISTITPKSGWNKFIKNIIDLEILELPDFTNIPNYTLNSMDADEISVEVASKNKYRIYDYPEPHAHLHLTQTKKIVEILKFIDNEFDLKMERFK